MADEKSYPVYLEQYVTEKVVSVLEDVLKVKALDVLKQNAEVQLRQTEALEAIAQGFKSVSLFLDGQTLPKILEGNARLQGVNNLLNGLLSSEGRSGLDARLMKQNALEIVHILEATFDKYKENLKDKDLKDPELIDSEKDFKKENDITSP